MYALAISARRALEQNWAAQSLLREKGCVFHMRLDNTILKVFRCFQGKPYWAREETDSPKTPFWTTVSPHDAFSAPLARSESREIPVCQATATANLFT